MVYLLLFCLRDFCYEGTKQVSEGNPDNPDTVTVLHTPSGICPRGPTTTRWPT